MDYETSHERHEGRQVGVRRKSDGDENLKEEEGGQEGRRVSKERARREGDVSGGREAVWAGGGWSDKVSKPNAVVRTFVVVSSGFTQPTMPSRPST